jgi:pimeloyl-ACP methyl ester carboxylesterase
VANELSALAEVAGETIDRLAITPAQSLHTAIATRVFRNTGPGAAPVRVVHDTIATALYGAARAAVTGTAAAASLAIRNAGGEADVRPLTRSRRGRLAVSAVNGFIGDRLDELDSDLAVPMSVRRRGADVGCDAAALRGAFPRATPRVAVFLHGLAETEEWWRRGTAASRGGDRRPFGVRLRRDLGLTPVDVRYNTGLRVEDNGARLGALLESLVEHWPVPVRELVVVGHSMGGLVARSACHQAGELGQAWAGRLRHIVTLGTPHHGAPLEKAVHAAAWLLRAVPEARPLAEILDLRSAGIRDLRLGIPMPLHGGCGHTFITATVTRDPDHPLGWLVGDLLVRTESAAGRCRERTIPVPPDAVVHVGGLTHFDLLDHPLVYERLREALGRSL